MSDVEETRKRKIQPDRDNLDLDIEGNVEGSKVVAAGGNVDISETQVDSRGSASASVEVSVTGPTPVVPPQPETADQIEERRWRERAVYLTAAMREYVAQLRRCVTELPDRPAHPYKDLFFFEIGDQAIFFGRDEAVRELVDEIRNKGRVTVLHALSGVGKTSLINAGVTPAILREDDVTLYALARVGAHYEDPGATIRKRTIEAAPPDHRPPDLSDLSLHDFLRLASAGLDGRELIIFLDQFEEFFIHLSPALRAPFIAELAECVDDASLPVKFVFSIRKDYFSDLCEFEPFVPTIFHSEYRLNKLTREQAAQAITQPVEPFGVSYGPDLVEALLDDLEQGGMELPHLQIICSRLYEGRLGDIITLAEYEALGGAEGILGGHLLQFVERLGRLKPVVQQILVEMVTSEETKRVLGREQIGKRVEAKPDEIDDALTRLVNNRFLRREAGGAEVRYEMAHEYLINQIRTWIDEDTRAQKQVEEMIAREVESWRKLGVLMERGKLDVVETQIEVIRLKDEEGELLLRSALAESHDLARRPGLVTDKELFKDILDEYAQDRRAAVRVHAAWTWAAQDTPDSLAALLPLALADPDSRVASAAGESLLGLERQRQETVLALVQAAQGEDRIRRSRALVLLTRLPLGRLSWQLRGRVLFMRSRLALAHAYERLLPPVYRRLAAGIAIGLLVIFVGLYVFLNNSYYISEEAAPTFGGSRVLVVKRGHPVFAPLPGLEAKIAEMYLFLRNVPLDDQSSIEQGKLTGFRFQTDAFAAPTEKYDRWATQVVEHLQPDLAGIHMRYLDEPPSLYIQKLIEALSSDESYVAARAPYELAYIVTVDEDPELGDEVLGQLTSLIATEDDPDVLSRVATTLGHIAAMSPHEALARKAVNQLTVLKDEGDDIVRRSAMQALGIVAATCEHSAVAGQAIDRLGPFLEDSSADVQNQAVQALTQVILGNEDLDVVAQAVEALVSFPPGGNQNTQTNAINGLTQAVNNNPNFEVKHQIIETLVSLLSHPDIDIRFSAYNAVIQIANWQPYSNVANSVIDSLIPLLGDNTPRVRRQAADALSQIATSGYYPDRDNSADQIIPRIVPYLENRDPEIRTDAADVLGRTLSSSEDAAVTKPAILALISHLNDDNGNVRDRCASALFGLGSRLGSLHYQALDDDTKEIIDSSSRALISLLASSDNASTQRVAADLLGIVILYVEDPELATEAVVALNRLKETSTDFGVQSSTIRTLGRALSKSGDSKLASQLVLDFTSPLQESRTNQDIRRAAAGTIGYAIATSKDLNANQAALDVLLSILEEPDTDIRTQVVWSLGQVGGGDSFTLARDSLERLKLLLRDREKIVKTQAIWAVARISIDSSNTALASESVQVVSALLEDKDNKDIHSDALSALAQIASDSQSPNIALEALESIASLPSEASILRETSAWQLQDVLFKNKDSRVSQKALHILAALLDDSDNYTRRAAFWALYWVAVDENDHNPELQKQALTILASHLTSGRAFFSAIQVMGDIVKKADDPTVARHAVESLIPLLDPVAQTPLVRRRAAEAVRTVVTSQDNAGLARQAVVALVPLIADNDRGVRDAAYGAIGSIISFFPQREVVEFAMDMLTDPQLIDNQSATVRGLVITAIRQVAVKSPTPALSLQAMNYLSETLRSEDDPDVLVWGVRAMSSILSVSGKNNELADLAISALTPLLGSPNSEVRSAAVSAIGDAIRVSSDPNTAKPALKFLTPLLSDDAVRVSAASAFREARATLSIEELIEGLDRPEDARDRLLTIEALFLRALRDPDQSDKIESGLSTEMLQAGRKAHVRIAVVKVRELLEIAQCVEAARRNPDLIPQIRVYLFSLTGHIMDHVSFAAREAILELNRLDVAVRMHAVSENPELIEQTRAYLNWLRDRGAEGSYLPRVGGQYPGVADEVWLDIESALRELDRMETSLKD